MLTTIDRPKKSKSFHSDVREIIDVTWERIVVTPDMARAWLDQNTSNRKVTKGHVDKIARDMKAGNFPFTGDAIRFDSNRVLIDGQHRLLACVKADTPFETLVIYNLQPETQDKLDAGKARNASDILSMTGHHNTLILSGACRLILEERQDKTIGKTQFTTSEILGVLDRHRELPSCVIRCAGKKYPRGLSIPQLATIYYVGKHLLNAPNIADEFLSVIQTGIPMYDGDAAHAYREKIVKDSGGSTALKRTEKWRLFKHAWNLFSVGQPSKLLRGSADVHFEGVKTSLF